MQFMKNKKKNSKTSKKTETSKRLAWWAVIIATVSAAASYALAAFGMDPVSDLTQTIFNGCVAYLVAYAGKSLGEKVSRNRHGLGADGLPYYSTRSDGWDISETNEEDKR